MGLFCEQCGHENEVGTRFCEECGARLETASKKQRRKIEWPSGLLERFSKDTKERKVMIASLAAVLVVGVMIAGLAINVNANVTAAEYNKSVALGDQYLANGDYEQAELAFNEAINIRPNIPVAYDKVKKVYQETGDTEKIEIITKKKETNVTVEVSNRQTGSNTGTDQTPNNVGKTEPTQPATTPAKPKKTYADIVKEKENQGRVLLDQEYSAATGKVGLVSASVRDMDNDGEDELLTVSCKDNKKMVLELELYGHEEDEIVKLDSETVDFDDADNPKGEYDLFLKSNEDEETYLYIQRDRILGTDAGEKGGLLYKIDSEFEKTLDTAAVESTVGYKLTVNEDTRDSNAAAQTPSGQLDNQKVKEDMSWWADEINSQLSDAGLECNGDIPDVNTVHSGIENNLPSFDSDDETQEHICRIKRGSDEDYVSGDKLFIEDFTELAVE